MKRPQLSYANVAATAALVIAVSGGGVAYAAYHVPKNSVISKSIVNGQVKGKDLRSSAVTGSKVADGSLGVSDLAAGARPRLVEGPVTNIGTLTAVESTVTSVSFTAPGNGYVLVHAAASFNAGETGTYIESTIYDGATKINKGEMDPGDVDGWYDQTQTLIAAAPVTAGPHTYTLKMDEHSVAATFSDYFGAQLVVEYFPSGSAPTGSAFRGALPN
jgi:hypothetical protein